MSICFEEINNLNVITVKVELVRLITTDILSKSNRLQGESMHKSDQIKGILLFSYLHIIG